MRFWAGAGSSATRVGRIVGRYAATVVRQMARTCRDRGGDHHRGCDDERSDLRSDLGDLLIASPDSVVLSDSQGISGTGRGIRGSESYTAQAEISTKGNAESAGSGSGVPGMTRRLGPNRYFVLEYKLAKPGKVTFMVESDIPVKTYIVRPKNLAAYRRGSKTFVYYGGFPDPRASQKQTLWLPFSDTWYLIISNPDKVETADLIYEVSF